MTNIEFLHSLFRRNDECWFFAQSHSRKTVVDGGTDVQDVRAQDNCSCVTCTSTIHGGRMPILHRYLDVTY